LGLEEGFARAGLTTTQTRQMPRAYDEKMSQRRPEKREKGPAKVKVKTKDSSIFKKNKKSA
jgi:hypothetical protein